MTWKANRLKIRLVLEVKKKDSREGQGGGGDDMKSYTRLETRLILKEGRQTRTRR